MNKIDNKNLLKLKTFFDKKATKKYILTFFVKL